jgi:hypothetical protein
VFAVFWYFIQCGFFFHWCLPEVDVLRAQLLALQYGLQFHWKEEEIFVCNGFIPVEIQVSKVKDQ